MNNKILLTAESQASDLKRVDGIAYSGGEVNQWWSDCPIVVDLSGMTFANQIPLMYNHNNDPEYRLGELNVEVVNGKLLVSGGIDTSTEKGNAIAETGRHIHWQLSIGADTKKAEKAENVTANGRQFKGPVVLVTESVLREVSVVAIGADADTEMTIAAGWNINSNRNNNQSSQGGKETMATKKKDLMLNGVVAPENEKNPLTAEEAAEEVKEETADVTAEEEVAEEAKEKPEEEENKEMAVKIEQRAKMADIVAILNGAPNEVVVKAIKQGWTVDMAKAVADSVKSVKASKPSTANILVKSGTSTDIKSIEAALSLRAGMSEDSVVKSLGEQATENGYRLRNMSLKDITRTCLNLSGKATGDFLGHEDIQAGFQTTDLPKLLGNVANKALLKSYLGREIAATKLCSAGDIADYKDATRVRIADIGNLKEVPAGGEVTETAIGEDYAINKVVRYAEDLWLDEALIINDDLGAFLRLPTIMGAKAANFVDETFFSKLTANANFTDGKALFHADHKNLKTGTTTALSLDAIKAAYSAMRKQTDKGGVPINILPKYLVVPAELEADALELVSTQVVVGGSSRTAAENIVSKWGLQVVASPYLDSNSTKAWYLFADPTVCDTFEIGYLRGQRTPIVEQAVSDLSRFGICYRVRFDFGIAPMDFRGVYKAKGEA